MTITINTTESCNLACSYCYLLTKRPNDLPLEYATRFINLLLTDPDPIGVAGTEDEWIIRQGAILDFLGGDALMRPQLVRDILRYWMTATVLADHRWAYRWRSSISTNGTLFDEPGVKDFLDEFRQNIDLGISVDGCPTIHNLNRNDSMSRILKNWQWYMDYQGPNAATKSTLNKESIPYLFESLRFLHEELGLRYINQNFAYEDLHLMQGDLDEFDRQMAKCVEYVSLHSGDLYWGMLRREEKRDASHSYCGSGCMPALSINGKIYPCFRFLPHAMADRAHDFHVGDVWSGFDHKDRFRKVRGQTSDKISEAKCLQCPVEHACGWCIAQSYSETGRFYRPTNICGTAKIRAKWVEIYWKDRK